MSNNLLRAICARASVGHGDSECTVVAQVPTEFILELATPDALPTGAIPCDHLSDVNTQLSSPCSIIKFSMKATRVRQGALRNGLSASILRKMQSRWQHKKGGPQDTL